MAVDLRKTYSNGSLEMLYNYENETLKQATNVLYQFPPDSQSVVQVKGQPYKPVRLHLTPVLHRGNHDSEMIVEHQGKDGKLFICFMLRKGTNPSLSFPLKEFSLDGFMSHCTTNQYYKTASKGHVLLCTSVMDVGNDFPSIYGTAKKKYKEIFEPNVFNVLNSIMTLVDNKNKVIDIEIENVLLKKGKKRDVVEGFSTNGHQEVDVETYMECSLLHDEDGGVDFDEYAVSPLGVSNHKRGNQILGMFLGIILTFILTVFIWPIFAVDLLGSIKFLQNKFYPGFFETRLAFILFISQLIFFILFAVLLGLGNEGITAEKGDKSQERVEGTLVTTGLYFLIIFFGGAAGIRNKVASGDLNYTYNPAIKFLGENDILKTFVVYSFHPMLHCKYSE
jgi:hypothetical protein